MFFFVLKNILRNKTRSTLTLLVVTVTALTSIISMGFTTGLIDLILKSFVQYQTGHIRVITPEYHENIRFRPPYYSITNISRWVEGLQTDDEIERVVPTFPLFGLVGLGGGTLSHQSRGLALPLSNNALEFPKKIKEGGISRLIIGPKFAQKLQASVGTPLLISTTTTEGGLNAIKPQLGGIAQFNMKAMDNNMFFLELSEAQRLLRAPDSAAEVFIYLKKKDSTQAVIRRLRKEYPNLVFQSYQEQIGPLMTAIEIEEKVIWLITIIIMMLGSLAVVNSLIAGIYDRMNEIGMLKAMGFSDQELSLMLVLEGGFYGIVGGTLGFLMGAGVMAYFKAYGLDLTLMLSNAALPVEPVIYPSMGWSLYLAGYLISISVPACVALIPSKHIRAITPVEALRA